MVAAMLTRRCRVEAGGHAGVHGVGQSGGDHARVPGGTHPFGGGGHFGERAKGEEPLSPKRPY
eukprot:516027-Pyramimonas_sp.AAC.2